MLASDREGHVRDATREALTQLMPRLGRAAEAEADRLIVVVEADHRESMLPSLMQAKGRHFILTGHVAANSLGDILLQQKRASRMPWNVHPPRGCNLWLADAVGAERVLPAFGAIADAPHLAAGLGTRLSLSSPLAL